MANDTSLPVRRAVVGFYRGAPAVVAIVEQRVHARVPAKPVWPYVRYGVDDAAPFLATGLDGMSIAMTMHAFAAGETDDDCRMLCRALVTSLDGRVLDLTEDAGFPATLKDIRWTRTQVLRDIDRADGWHGIVQFAGLVVS